MRKRTTYARNSPISRHSKTIDNAPSAVGENVDESGDAVWTPSLAAQLYAQPPCGSGALSLLCAAKMLMLRSWQVCFWNSAFSRDSFSPRDIMWFAARRQPGRVRPYVPEAVEIEGIHKHEGNQYCGILEA
jgi:hypothetical protein